MNILGYLLIAVALVAVYLAWRLLSLWRTLSQASAEVDRRWEAEEKLVEIAPWFGKTGLSEEDERELPRYLRREFGEVGAGDGGLKAADLIYLGVQNDGNGTAHFWRIPASEGEKIYAFAYIEVAESGESLCYGWGGREPPHKN